MIRYLALPALIAVVGIVYLFFTNGEPAGSALLLIFAGAMGVFTWVLLPTADNEGPTAPNDPDFEVKGP
jgi:fucose permease